MQQRLIHLRRAPVIHTGETPFVPTRVPLAEIDRHWQHLLAENPAYFDGSLRHVTGVHRNGHGGATVHTQPGAYRFWAVQHAFNLSVGVRPLGVKGLVIRDGRVLFSRRSETVAAYGGAWEFSPGGVVEAGRTPPEIVQAELTEETRLTATREPVAIAMYLDEVVGTWEIIHRIDAPAGEPTATSEYTEHRWLTPDDLDKLPDNITEVSRVMLPLARAALASSR